MEVQSPSRRITRRLPALWIAAILALACSGTALAAATAHHHQHKPKSRLAGKWTGSYSGALSGNFTIHWKQTGARLHGSIHLSNPNGTYDITGSIHKGKIKFGAVSAGAKYKGKLSGTTMSGTWTSPQGGGSWNASKS